jgi:hypothetical protein
MKKIKLEVMLEVEDNIEASDIVIWNSDVIDGFEISRNSRWDDDVTVNFFLKECRLISCIEEN